MRQPGLHRQQGVGQPLSTASHICCGAAVVLLQPRGIARGASLKCNAPLSLASSTWPFFRAGSSSSSAWPDSFPAAAPASPASCAPWSLPGAAWKGGCAPFSLPIRYSAHQKQARRLLASAQEKREHGSWQSAAHRRTAEWSRQASGHTHPASSPGHPRSGSGRTRSSHPALHRRAVRQHLGPRPDERH